MKRIVLLLAMIPLALHGQQPVKIFGYVSDFEGNRIPDAEVKIIDNAWQDVSSARSGENGYYELIVPQGHYMALLGMVWDQYPAMNAVPPEDMRLEFWAWNIIADRDLEIHPRYHRLELYGTTVFETFGAYPGYFIFFRPMSLSKYLANEKENSSNAPSLTPSVKDISVDPENLQLRVYADEQKVTINSIQRVEEYTGSSHPMGAYLVQVERPENSGDKPYVIFRVTVKDTSNNEMGENLYFYRIPEFYSSD